MENVAFSLEAMLPLEMIRAHTNLIDCISTPDNLLILHRDAAFEAAQRYTGLWFRGKRWQTEQVKLVRKYRPKVVHKLKYPPLDGNIYLYGGTIGGAKVVRVAIDACAVTIQVPSLSSYEFNRCCDPCAAQDQDRLAYWTGLECAADFPPGIREGMLKFIAYNVSNTGEVGTASVGGSVLRPVVQDPVVASGAGAMWHQYRRYC